jgi:peptidoglycan-associated lipoprotein
MIYSKHTLWAAATAFTVLFSGCGQNTPDMDGNVLDADHIQGDTVSIDENGYGGNYNSSADGFKSIYFDFADYSISGRMESNMSHDTQLASQASAKVKVEGNCDEFGTDEYNYALGLKRAKAVKDAMVAQGVDANQIVMVSFGESKPVCSESTDSCYERNRRVDLRLVK